MRVTHLTLVQVLLAISTAQRILPGCPKIKFENGSVRWKRGSPNNTNNFGIFKCHDSFHLLGEKKLLCRNGGLNGSMPVCVSPGCDVRGKSIVENGYVLSELSNSKLSVICYEGYETHQFPVIVCNKIIYNASLPQCYRRNPPMKCNFDDGLCGWTQDTLDPNDWDQQIAATSCRDQGFGPDKDHSTSGKGQYLYLDAEITEDNPNASLARLYSPVYAAKFSFACFTFWYHIFGDEDFGSLGTLQVEQQLAGENAKWTVSSHTPFKIEGDQGDAWRKGVLALETTTQSFRIMIEAKSGSSNMSVIAIDDLKLSILDCDEIPKTSSEILSCRYRCGSGASPFSTSNGCSCAALCYHTNDCCADYVKYCEQHDASIMPTYASGEETSAIYRTKTTTSTPKTTPPWTTVPTLRTLTATTAQKTTLSTPRPTPSIVRTTHSSTKMTPSTALQPKATTRQYLSRTTPKVYPAYKITTIISTIRPKGMITSRATSKTTLVNTPNKPTETPFARITTTPASPKYREGDVEFQPHSFESPLGSILGALVGIAILLIVSTVAIGIFMKRQKQRRLYSKDDHEVAFLTQNAEEPILDFTLASIDNN